MTKPLKRHPALVPLSKDHHFGLLLCWKIRTGVKKEVAPDRIARYVSYFFENHLKRHFEEEEQHIFTLLPETNDKRKKAERQHRKLGRLAQKLSLVPEKTDVTLGQIEEELEAHIRFEERELFPYLQGSMEESELEQLKQTIEEVHDPQQEKWADEFWAK